MKCYARLGHGPGSFPNAEASSSMLISLPIFPEMERAQLAAVCEGIEDFGRASASSRAVA